MLTSFPILAAGLAIERVAWPLPRREVIAAVGDENQSLPLLVLAEGVRSRHETGACRGRGFVADKDGILAVLAERHGFPDPHP